MCQYVFLKVWYFFPVTIVRELEQHPLVINNMVAKQARAGGFQRESLTGTHLGPTICNTPVKKVKIDMSLLIHHLWNKQHNHTSQTNCTVCKNFYIINTYLLKFVEREFFNLYFDLITVFTDISSNTCRLLI